MKRSRFRSMRPASAAMAIALALGALVGVPAPASAANLAAFDPGYLITDTVFYDAGAMNADQIQAFLQAKAPNCRPAADGTACLKDYRETTPTRPATDRCRSTYQGAANELASTIIAKVAAACGINPRVLIVTLQKEQSLVTRSPAGTADVYAKALGFACSDTAPCDPQYAGFANQVYSAAAQLRNYALNPSRYNVKAGQTNPIKFHPNAACGSSSVFVRNQATASLYNYTPYQPNAAALAAGYATAGNTDGVFTTDPMDGDCASYGNRNFWAYFTDWFGSTISANPVGILDVVTATGGDSVRVQGWTLDPDVNQPVPIHVYVDGTILGSTTAGTSRPDIAAAYPGWGALHGFDLVVPVPQGSHQVCVYAINQLAGDNNPLLGCRSVTVANHAPQGNLDIVQATPSTLTVRGWAYDQDVADPVQVHVYVGDQIIASGLANASRPDVGAAVPGAGNARGYVIEFPVAAGTHQVCTYAIDRPTAGANNPRLGCQTVTVVNALPVGNLDIAQGGAGAIGVQGWAWDSDAPTPISVHVYVDGTYAGQTATGVPRPDVAAAVPGASATTGFATTVPATPGAHEVCAWAINGPAGVNPRLACAQVAVS